MEPELQHDTVVQPNTEGTVGSINATEPSVASIGANPMSATNSITGSRNQEQDSTINRVITSMSRGVSGDFTELSPIAGPIGAEDAMESLRRDIEAEQVNVATKQLELAGGKTAEEAGLIVSAVQKNLIDYKTTVENNKQLAPYYAMVEGSEGSHRLTKTQKMSVAGKFMFNAKIAEIWDSMTWVDKSADILGIIAGPDANLTVAEMAARSGEEQLAAVSVFESLEFWHNYAKIGSNMSPEEQVEWRKNTLEMLEGIDDNQLQTIMRATMAEGLSEDDLTDRAIELAFAPLDVLALVGVGKVVLSNLPKFSKLRNYPTPEEMREAANFVKVADELPDKSLAAIGANRIDVAASGGPMVTPEIQRIAFTGAPESVGARIRTATDEVDNFVEEAKNHIDLEEVAIDEVDVLATKEAIQMKFSKKENIENLRIERDGKNLNITYDKYDNDGNLTQVEETHRFTKSDVGVGIESTDSGLVQQTVSGVASPKIVLDNKGGIFVHGVEQAQFAQSKAQKMLEKSLNAALAPVKGLSKTGLRNVNKMLAYLEGKPKEYTYADLVVSGIGGLRLTDSEFVAWKSVRHLMDRLHEVENTTLRNEMSYNDIRNVTVNDRTSYAKVYDTPEKAQRAYNNGKYRSVLVSKTDLNEAPGRMDVITPERMKEMYDRGFVLTSAPGDSPTGMFKLKDDTFQYAFTKRENTGPLDEVVLNKVPNYMPITRRDANYFIQVQGSTRIDGQDVPTNSTVAWASTKTQADAWIKKQIETDFVNGIDKKYKLADNVGTLVDELGVEESIRMNGGLVRGSRGQGGVEYAGLTDTKDMVVDPLDSVQEAINFTARRMPMSVFRMGLQARVYNDIATRTGRDLRSTTPWRDLGGEIETMDLGRNEGYRQVLRNAYNQIDALASIPSEAEQKMQGLIRTTAVTFDKLSQSGVNIAKDVEVIDSAIKKAAHATAKWLYRTESSNPIVSIKSATYHLTLGSLNLAQTPIQAASMLNTWGIAPTAFTKSIPAVLRAGVMDLINVGEKSAMKQLLRDPYTPTSFERDYAFWRRSGLYDSIVQTGGDFGSVSSGQPYDAGLLRRMFGAALHVGGTPFRIGEAVNKRSAFFTALEEVKAMDGFVYNDHYLSLVQKRTEEFTFNMSAGNKAAYQKGLLSLPLQFRQIVTKSTEQYLGTWFTPGERARAGLVQTVLFGKAGIPIFGSLAAYTIAQSGITEGMTADEAHTVEAGLVGNYLNNMLGLDVDASTRITTSSDVYGELVEMVTEDKPFYEKVMGASYNTLGKPINILGNIYTMAGIVATSEDVKKEEILAVAEAISVQALDVPSGSRNTVAAWDLYNNKIFRNGKGQHISETDPSLWDAVVRGAGFQNLNKTELYELRKNSFEMKETKEAYVDRMVGILFALQKVGDNEAASLALNFLYGGMVDNLESRTDKQQVKDLLKSRLMNARGKKEQIIKQAALDRLSKFYSDKEKADAIIKKYAEGN